MPALEHIYLEDSWVLDVRVSYRIVKFVFDLVLTENHRLDTPPPPHEAYCYRKAELIFDGVSSINWDNMGLRPAVDATGTFGFGNVDFSNKQGNLFVLGGDWGRMKVTSQNPTLVFLQAAEEQAQP